MLFYTNCARGLAKNEIRLYLKEQKFLRLGGGPPPSKYAHGGMMFGKQ